MNVRLSPEQQAMVREKVELGYYRDEDDVIANALALLDEHDKARLEALLAALEEGEADLRAGRSITIRTQDELDALFADL
jgi:putative addiction module CopG family antidote